MTNYQTQIREVVKYINRELIAEVPRDIYEPQNDIADNLDDIIAGKVSPRVVPVTTTLMLLNSCLGNNTLIEGGMGTGKTKLASVIGSLMFQIPYEFLDRKRVVGTPGVTVNEIYATHALEELNRGNDVAYLYLSFFAPFVLIDELNRFSELEQNRIREGIATGVWSYAGNHSFIIGNQTVVSAVNPEAYGGTFPLNENLLDNYAAFLWPAYYNPLAHGELVRGAEEKIRAQLGLSEVVDKLMEFYKTHKNDPELIKKEIKNMQQKTLEAYTSRNIPFLANGFMAKIREEINAVPFAPEANLFFYSLLGEMTHSRKFGRLRYEDPCSDDSHDVPYSSKKGTQTPVQDGEEQPKPRECSAYLSTMLKEGLAGRFLKDWTQISKALAWYFGVPQVGVDELRAAFVYTAAHRLKPETSFFQDVQNNTRSLPIKFETARRVAEVAWNNYSDFRGKGENENPGFNELRKAIKLISGKQTLEPTDESTRDALRILKTADHPLARSVLEGLAVSLLRKM